MYRSWRPLLSVSSVKQWMRATGRLGWRFDLKREGKEAGDQGGRTNDTWLFMCITLILAVLDGALTAGLSFEDENAT